MDFHASDIRDPGLKTLFMDCESVIHLAFVVGRPYGMSLQEAASINLSGTWNTCRVAAEAGVHTLVISSSVAAYGSLRDNPVPLIEEHPLRGLLN
ncbi:NAD-dependent epimerase/dehydratase family protein [Dictyobacter arantiisoli]|uniref:NAD-dependent epimerase/dehydratase domain-containing protein n=1 Tax=Dictyobacter arantiisoli TaxID=2014874 RepID=A0A5A5TE77_9CHLR|nr:NAD-dependent epimerase/dehydratase family protein [Dictyobacter arantiisoli]GCF09446.1 hypothetical protein KDI_30100 [Dictyobacter arantiisoli]